MRHRCKRTASHSTSRAAHWGPDVSAQREACSTVVKSTSFTARCTVFSSQLGHRLCGLGQVTYTSFYFLVWPCSVQRISGVSWCMHTSTICRVPKDQPSCWKPPLTHCLLVALGVSSVTMELSPKHHKWTCTKPPLSLIRSQTPGLDVVYAHKGVGMMAFGNSFNSRSKNMVNSHLKRLSLKHHRNN